MGLMGRKTYEAGLRMAGGKFESHGLRCYIFSRSLPEGERDGAIFVREELKTFVEQLRQKKGKDIWLIGGHLTREFLKDDLVDELYLEIRPALIGDGIPLFAAEFPQREFALTGAKTYSGSVIALKYERVRGKAAAETKSTSKSSCKLEASSSTLRIVLNTSKLRQRHCTNYWRLAKSHCILRFRTNFGFLQTVRRKMPAHEPKDSSAERLDFASCGLFRCSHISNRRRSGFQGVRVADLWKRSRWHALLATRSSQPQKCG